MKCLSVILYFVTNSIDKKKKNFMVLQMKNERKKNSHWKYIDGFIPFVFLSVNYWWNNNVGDCAKCLLS
jgi:hypothetical protein